MKKIRLMLLAALSVSFILFYKIDVMAFNQRFTAPNGEKYYTSDNPFYISGYGMPNCTCYAWGRIYELLGSKPALSTGNGSTFWTRNTKYPKGQVPKVGAVACWGESSVTYGYGHVAVVEQVNGDGSFVISESHYKGVYWRRKTISNKNHYGPFQGFIYVKDFGDSNTQTFSSDIKLTPKDDWWAQRGFYDLNDNIIFFLSGKNVNEFGLTIEDPNTHHRYWSKGVSANGYVSIPARDIGVGDFGCWCSGSPYKSGVSDSAYHRFKIVGAPQVAEASVDKGEYNLNEEVFINLRAHYIKGQKIKIYKDGALIVDKLCPYGYRLNPRDFGLGKYTAQYCVYNGAGEKYSNWVTFYVKETPVYATEVKMVPKEQKDVYHLDDKIIFKLSGKNAKGFLVNIENPETHEKYLSKDIDSEGDFSILAKDLGVGEFGCWCSGKPYKNGLGDSEYYRFRIVGAPSVVNAVVEGNSIVDGNLIIGNVVTLRLNSEDTKWQKIILFKNGELMIDRPCDKQFTINSTIFGVGKYSVKFVAYNDSGSKESNEITFNIIKNSIIGVVKPPVVINKVLGDANADGRVDMIDALLVRQRILGKSVWLEDTADYNNDMKITMLDYLLIRKVILSS